MTPEALTLTEGTEMIPMSKLEEIQAHLLAIMEQYNGTSPGDPADDTIYIQAVEAALKVARLVANGGS